MRIMLEQPISSTVQSAGSPQSGGGSSRKVMRRVAKSRSISPEGGDEGISLLESVSEPLAGDRRTQNGFFKCFQCGTEIPVGSEICPKCGTKYVMEDISGIEMDEDEFDAEALDDATPLLDERSISCGYFDVDKGVFTYAGTGKRPDDYIFECKRCKTVLEFEARGCPLCGGAIEKVKEGIAEIASGVLVGEDLDPENSQDVFCLICGDLLALDKGRCIICGTELVSSEESAADFLCPVVPAESIVFVHLDVEAGEIDYIVRNGVPAGSSTLASADSEPGDDFIDCNDSSEI